MCAPHELHYDPARATGCVLCRRATASAPRSPALWAKIAVALSLAALVAFANRTQSARADASRRPPDVTAAR